MTPSPAARPPVRCPRCGGELDPDSEEIPCPGCALAVTFAEPLARFGGYEILEELGRGGMGQVYLAHHLASGRIVALKTPVRAGIPSPEILRRFHGEAEAVAALDHPGIVPIYEVGEEEGLPFFTMKFAEGGSLAERIGDYAGDPRRAARLLAGIAEAVHHAHVRGILHRDLKPQNILLDEAGRAYVSDFGVSRWLAREADLTQTGAVFGSPNYMAPEQIETSSRDLTVAADVFSLGAILYHLLRGEPPFRAASLAGTLRRLGDGDIQRLPASVPRDLQAICLRALEPLPAGRYTSARAFAADLRAWLDGRPVSIRRPSPVERLWRFARRNPLPTALAGATLVAIIAGGTAATLSHHRALLAETARADAAEALARDRLQANLITDARTARLSGQPGQRHLALRGLREAWALAPSLAIRNEAIAALALPDVGPPEPSAAIPAPSPSRGDLTEGLSPDRRTVTIRDRAGGTLGAFTLSHPVTSLAWSPGQEQLIVGSADKHVSVWNRTSRQLTRRLTGRESISTQLAVSHQGGFVADITAEGAVRIWNLSSGEDLLVAPLAASGDTAPRWSGDDATLHFQPRGSDAWSRVAITLPTINRRLEPAEPEPSFEDARTIDLDGPANRAVVGTEKQITLWNLDSGRPTRAWSKHPAEWALARFLPDDDSLLIGGWSSGVLRAPAADPDAARPLQALPGAFLVALDRESGLAGFVDNTDGEFELLAAPYSGPSVRLARAKPFELAFGPAAQWIATSSYGDDAVEIRRWPGLDLLATLRATGTAPHLAVSPRGDLIYLAANSGGSLWRTAEWSRDREIRLDEAQHSAMFFPDGGMLAIETRQSVRLHDPRSGAELARLPAPGNPSDRSSASFTISKDSRTVALQTSGGGILLWDLPELRRQLSALGMDW